jgi:hypothetical protein
VAPPRPVDEDRHHQDRTHTRSFGPPAFVFRHLAGQRRQAFPAFERLDPLAGCGDVERQFLRRRILEPAHARRRPFEP